MANQPNDGNSPRVNPYFSGPQSPSNNTPSHQKSHRGALIAWLCITAAVIITVAVVLFIVLKKPAEIEPAKDDLVKFEDPLDEGFFVDYNEEAIDSAAIAEEILQSVEMTQLQIVEDPVDDVIRSQDEVIRSQDERPIGSTDFDNSYRDEVRVETPARDNDNTIYSIADQMPMFPGGEAALMQWIGEHIQYPAIAAEDGIQGRVVVSFVVLKDGSIGEVKVVRSKDPYLDREAVRVIKTLPKFSPGRNAGQPVNVWYTLPVNFKLS